MIRRALRAVLRPLFVALLRRFPPADPWERIEQALPLRSYGSGARFEFAWYFDGDSAIAVASLDDVRAWLAECEYVTDPHLFQEGDFWQHPRTFEQLRKGDCEDHAIWAWRKLLDLGYDADLVVGRCLPWKPGEGRHAWVVFRDAEGAEYLFETVAKGEGAIRPLGEVRERYLPEVGVARDRRRFAYSGYLIAMRRWHLGGEQPPDLPRLHTAGSA